MQHLYIELENGLPLFISRGMQDSRNNGACVFQLYYSHPEGQGKSLCDLNNYFGMVSFDPASQQFYYSPGNRSISADEILQVIDCIQTKIFKQ